MFLTFFSTRKMLNYFFFAQEVAALLRRCEATDDNASHANANVLLAGGFVLQGAVSVGSVTTFIRTFRQIIE